MAWGRGERGGCCYQTEFWPTFNTNQFNTSYILAVFIKDWKKKKKGVHLCRRTVPFVLSKYLHSDLNPVLATCHCLQRRISSLRHKCLQKRTLFFTQTKEASLSCCTTLNLCKDGWGANTTLAYHTHYVAFYSTILSRNDPNSARLQLSSLPYMFILMPELEQTSPKPPTWPQETTEISFFSLRTFLCVPAEDVWTCCGSCA